jgi:4'-phosphopantetheinyl transferase
MAVPAGQIVVARVGPTAEAAAAAGDGWLTPVERARLAAMGSPQRRRQFLAGHWLARTVAARRLGIDVDGFTLVQADDGSPRLHLDGRASDWHVSLTHSGDRVACALAPAPVGVDLEFPRPGRDLAGLAAFAFAPDEAARLAALPDDRRLAAFTRFWSLKEARGKRLGEGLLPRRARRVSAWPCAAHEAHAAAWPLDDGTLAVAGERVDAFVVDGLADAASPTWWRFVDAIDAGDPDDTGRGAGR